MPEWLIQLLDTRAGMVLLILAAVIVASVIVLIALVAKFGPKLRQLGHLLDDLGGEDARPGVPARPGIMERMGTHEETLEGHTKMLGSIKHQVFPNGGSSMNDRLGRVEQKLNSGNYVPPKNN